MYTDVRLLTMYLRRLFAKALEGYTSELSLLLTGCQWFHTVSSFSFMKNSKFKNVHGRTFLNNGIHAAAANSPRRIRTDRDVRGSTQ